LAASRSRRPLQSDVSRFARSPEDPTEATSEKGSFKRPLNPKDGQTYDPYENTERNEG